MEEKLNDANELVSQSTDQILEQRGSRYGKFENHAALSQKLYTSIIAHIQLHGDISTMQPYHLESLSMICHKLARIANGDPNYDDNWKDIAGYAELVVKILHNKGI